MSDRNLYFLNDRKFSLIPKVLNDNYIRSNRFTEIGFKGDDVLFNDESILIIFEPVKIRGIYYSIYKVWKCYFEVHFPSSKIIVAGFINHQSSNYIDLLNLPGDFQTFVSHAMPVSSDWKAPVECADVLERMKQFFKGHGKDSLISQLNKIQQSLNVAYVTAMEEEGDFQEIRDLLLTPYFIPEWEELRCRWDYYSSFFEYLPFLPAMKSIGKAVNEISVFFSGNHINRNTFLNQQFDEKIRHVIQKLLQEIDKNYIRPEIYNEK